MHIRWIGAAAALLVLASGAASAATLHFRASLKGPDETPPNATTGRGAVEVTLDTVTKAMTYTVTYSGLNRAGGGGPFPRSGWTWRHGPAGGAGAQGRPREPDARHRDDHRRPDEGPRGRQVVLQHPHLGEPRGRGARPADARIGAPAGARLARSGAAARGRRCRTIPRRPSRCASPYASPRNPAAPAGRARPGCADPRRPRWPGSQSGRRRAG